MAIEFIDCQSGSDIYINNIHRGYFYITEGTPHLDIRGRLIYDELEQILSKMKELQGEAAK